MLVTMTYTDATYTYELNGHLNPKDWNVTVDGGYLLVQADEPIQLRDGSTRYDHFEYKTKLSKQIPQGSEFEVRGG